MRFTRTYLPLLILLVAAALRLPLLAAGGRLHPDEALFATFARSAALDGRWMLPGALDKPPLSLYAVALSMQFVAAHGSSSTLLDFDVYSGEFAARLPGTFASLLLVAVTYALTLRLLRSHWTAVLAAALLALSPFAIAFSATVFTDGLMLLFMLLALWMAAARRPLWCGLWLGLAFASKQQAAFYLPLVLAVAWAQDSAGGVSSYWRSAARVIVPFALMVGLLLLWDAARGEVGGMFALAAANNNPERLLITPTEMLPRLLTWWQDAAVFAGGGLLTALLGSFALAGVALRPRPLTVILLLYVLAYGAAHWLLPFNLYDRYLLPLLPLFMVLAAHGLWRSAGFLRKRLKAPRWALSLLVVLLLALLLPGAFAASEGQASVGGDRGQHEGIDQLAAYLNQQALGAIVYDRWLGWELGYYLGQWTDKRRVYYPTPAALVADALLQPDPAPRYFVAPASQPVDAWLSALREGGFTLRLTYHRQGFIVYELLPPA